jgi:hypothetical protein
VNRDTETHRPDFGGSNGTLSQRRGNLDIFIPFFNMNLLFGFHAILKNEKSSGGRRRWRMRGGRRWRIRGRRN